MSCKSCKEKKDIKEELINSSSVVDKRIVWFVVIWSILGVYGLYSLISNLL